MFDGMKAESVVWGMAEKAVAKMEDFMGTDLSVSVFVAARNEEENLEACLTALSAQNFPGTWEVWIADDHSTDRTPEISLHFCSQFSHFHFLQVPNSQNDVQGKALALGCLAEKATGQIFLVCDADMQMPTGWISAMVSAMSRHKTDLINGTTATDGNNWFSALQAMDWLLPQGTFAWMSRLGITYTAMGNNMGITRKAYEATGGYLTLPFSLTEDFELFKHARNKGFRLIHEYDEAVFGISAPQKSIADWVTQHVRWMIGFMQLPFSQQWVFYGQLLFYPMLIISLFFNWWPIIWAIYGLKTLYDGFILSQVKRFRLLLYLPLYEMVWWPSYMWCWVKYGLSSHIVWKGRSWEKK